MPSVMMLVASGDKADSPRVVQIHFSEAGDVADVWLDDGT